MITWEDRGDYRRAEGVWRECQIANVGDAARIVIGRVDDRSWRVLVHAGDTLLAEYAADADMAAESVQIDALRAVASLLSHMAERLSAALSLVADAVDAANAAR